MENSNAIFNAQMQNKEFKAAVLNQLEEISSKNAYEFKMIKSTKNFKNIFFILILVLFYFIKIKFLGKLQNLGDPNPINFRETDFSKNLDLGFNLDSSLGFSNHNTRQIIKSSNLNNLNSKSKNGKFFILFD
jgi:hypothetical protein